MRRQIPYGLIQPGFHLPGALCDESGRVLIPSGTLLTEADIAKLGSRVIVGLYCGDDWPGEPDAPGPHDGPSNHSDAHETIEAPNTSAEADTNVITIDSLPIGMRLSQDIYDRAGVLLLAAGSRITARFLYLLRQRGVKTVCLRPPQAQQIEEPPEITTGRQLDERLATELNTQDLLGSRTPRKRHRLSLDALWNEARHGLEKHISASAVLAETCDVLQSGKTMSGDEMRSLVDEFMVLLTLDSDLLVMIVSIQETLGEYLFDHSVNVSLLSMAIADQFGMDRHKILEVGLGGIFEDVGMLRLPEAIRLAPCTLTSEQWNEIRRHPIYTLDYLEQIRHFPRAARFIGYQVHERADRSGYPRERSATTVHPFAKIVAVADAYAAMTRPRPYRPAMHPHEAVKQILIEGSLHKFDRMIIRAFLDRVSAFPIGSAVELSNGLTGKVIRANPGAHTRPIIAQTDSAGAPTDQTIDLSKETHLEIVRAL